MLEADEGLQVMTHEEVLEIAAEKLAYLRDVAASYSAGMYQLREELALSVTAQAIAEMHTDLLVIKEQVAQAEQEVREAALAVYEETGEKKPHPAVPIKMYKVLEYDEYVAFKYIRENLPVALKADWALFEKVAKAVGGKLGFVTEHVEPRATIARNLGKWMPKEIPESLVLAAQLPVVLAVTADEPAALLADTLSAWYLALVDQMVEDKEEEEAMAAQVGG